MSSSRIYVVIAAAGLAINLWATWGRHPLWQVTIGVTIVAVLLAIAWRRDAEPR
jgi:hypothetical protein